MKNYIVINGKKAELTKEQLEKTVYFSNRETAEKAIKEVVEPFMKEHPEFVW